jgi:hypothetical protein
MTARIVGFLIWLVIYPYARLFVRQHDICDGDGDLYLRRWYLNREETFMLHKFVKSDRKRGHHNHPWIYMRSRILRGTYTEHRPGVLPRLFKPGMINTLFGDTFHRVTLTNNRPVWTLFGVGPKHGKSWGFLSPRGRFKVRPEGMGACPGVGAPEPSDAADFDPDAEDT